MVNFYLSFGDDRVRVVSSSPDLDSTLRDYLKSTFILNPHSNWRNVRNVTDIDFETLDKEAKTELSRCRDLPAGSLDTLVLAGPLRSVNCGHNGYTWKGKPERLNLNELVGNSSSSMLISGAFIGSGSNVYGITIPINIRADTKDHIPREEKLPPFLAFEKGEFFRVEYDIQSGQFLKTQEIEAIKPTELKMVETPKVRTIYFKDDEQVKIAHHYERLNWKTEIKRGLYEILSPLGRFEDQVINFFSPAGIALRLLSDGDGDHDWVSGEQIATFSYANFDEIHEAATAIRKGVDRDDRIERLNHFLLYKALEQNEANEGSFIVGKIGGDTQTIHLPYLKVERR